MKQSIATATTWVVMVVLLACLGVPTAAQYALGDGRILDNNLQLGSGGVNPARAAPDFRARNYIITGNVAGLGFFHDAVGYGAPNEFRDAVGDDDLFRFRAQSYTVPGRLGGYQLNRVMSGYGVTGVFRSQGGVSLGTLRREGALNTLLTRPDRSFSPYQRRGDLGGTRRDDDPFADTAMQRVGVVVQPDGRLLEITASPLLGVRQRAIDQPVQVQPPSPPVTSPVGPSPGTIDAGPLQGVGVANDPSSPQRPNGTPTADDRPGISARLAPSVELGLQILASSSSGSSQGDARGEQRLIQLESSLFGQPGAAAPVAGEDVYADLLWRITQPTAGGTAKPDRPDQTGKSPVLAPPTAEQLAAAAAARRRAMRQARGLPVDDAPNTTKPDASKPDMADPDTALLSAPLTKLVDKLDYDLPALSTLAGKSATAFNGHLRDAESALAAGRYFDAERSYRRALQLKRGHPLATAGLIHAQLGAALIRSAALNLRQLLGRYPQLMATRYEARLLPPADRLKQLQQRLGAMIGGSDRSEPALMLAYLGYQAGNAALTRHGLDLAQARSPRDPLIHLLRRVWLDKTTAPPTRK